MVFFDAKKSIGARQVFYSSRQPLKDYYLETLLFYDWSRSNGDIFNSRTAIAGAIIGLLLVFTFKRI